MLGIAAVMPKPENIDIDWGGVGLKGTPIDPEALGTKVGTPFDFPEPTPPPDGLKDCLNKAKSVNNPFLRGIRNVLCYAAEGLRIVSSQFNPNP